MTALKLLTAGFAAIRNWLFGVRRNATSIGCSTACPCQISRDTPIAPGDRVRRTDGDIDQEGDLSWIVDATGRGEVWGIMSSCTPAVVGSSMAARDNGRRILVIVAGSAGTVPLSLERHAASEMATFLLMPSRRGRRPVFSFQALSQDRDQSHFIVSRQLDGIVTISSASASPIQAPMSHMSVAAARRLGNSIREAIAATTDMALGNISVSRFGRPTLAGVPMAALERVEAFRWTGGADQVDDPVWMVEAMERGGARIGNDGNGYPVMYLAKGMVAYSGDYIILRSDGTIRPVSTDEYRYHTVLSFRDGPRPGTHECAWWCPTSFMDSLRSSGRVASAAENPCRSCGDSQSSCRCQVFHGGLTRPSASLRRLRRKKARIVSQPESDLFNSQTESDLFRWTGDIDLEGGPSWIVDAMERGEVWLEKSGLGVTMHLPDGMVANRGDYVVLHAGRIYPLAREGGLVLDTWLVEMHVDGAAQPGNISVVGIGTPLDEIDEADDISFDVSPDCAARLASFLTDYSGPRSLKTLRFRSEAQGVFFAVRMADGVTTLYHDSAEASPTWRDCTTMTADSATRLAAKLRTCCNILGEVVEMRPPAFSGDRPLV